MKLIDILVQELPKRGGWPGAIPVLVQNSSGYVYQAGGGEHIYRLELADDWNAEVTCEKYFDALRALKPVWDGNGLPPVGCRIEANSDGEWVEATVAFTDRPEGHSDAVAWNEALVFDCKTTRPFWADEFRPIRSKADKKRDAACDAMHKWWREIAGQEREDGSLIDIYSGIYDAIAAGKVPGIRIE